jgi:hypothetical protein
MAPGFAFILRRRTTWYLDSHLIPVGAGRGADDRLAPARIITAHTISGAARRIRRRKYLSAFNREKRENREIQDCGGAANSYEFFNR